MDAGRRRAVSVWDARRLQLDAPAHGAPPGHWTDRDRRRGSFALGGAPSGVAFGDDLVVAQTFRILVEVLIHESSTIGLAPRQMTWQGYDFDIVTGITALVLAPFARSAPMSLVVAWNCLGLTLLLWVVGIAAVSFPTPFQLLRPDSTWLTLFPYVWLPSVLVTAALLGRVVPFSAS